MIQAEPFHPFKDRLSRDMLRLRYHSAARNMSFAWALVAKAASTRGRTAVNAFRRATIDDMSFAWVLVAKAASARGRTAVNAF